MNVPILKNNIRLHRTAEQGIIMLAVGYNDTNEDQNERGDKLHSTPINYAPINIDGYIVDYLSLCDGTRDKETIDMLFLDKHDSFLAQSLAHNAWEWLKTNSEVVELYDEILPEKKSIPLTGTRNSFYPLHASIEIIETCNFHCAHCYYSASPYKKGILSLDNAIEILDRLHANGVIGVELTGGECTIHPSFRQILDYATNLFSMVAIISNGYKIGTDRELSKYIAGKNNVIVQISVDAIGERHNKFRKHKNAFNPAIEAICRMVEYGIPTRMASSISEENIDQILDLYLLAKKIDVSVISFAPVASIGRGCNITEQAHGSKKIIDAISDVLAPYHGDPILGNSNTQANELELGYEPTNNCGAGWRTFTIDYDGEVRACGFARESKKFGNLLNDDYSLIFGQKSNFLFNNAPSPGGKECIGCKYYMNCAGCFVKAFMVSETEYKECPWRKKWFGDMPLGKDKFSKVKSAEVIFSELPRQENTHICNNCSN